ncbi:undecaprenol kinase/diacylglycerol kinase (ATP) [Terribacillus halophilus]|uniref:Undecaprenol kinase/diacylglycerol kinase (ATP) n=1 Tax=Terribacillus halophilus TaxID=361279 RepID=A0A1G6SRG4_9BACI|nr:diacylglycerol kinase family protein [Terribacillus halophilus]SDD19409.1 undecaprenol kinase/diacylglycerol kinase (ATP) [Terribacillus halophilus]
MASDSSGKKTKSGIGFRYAWNGIRWTFLKERNFRIHTIAAVIALLAGFIFRIGTAQWAAILLSIGFVIATEMINTVIELAMDHLSPEQSEAVGLIKDIAAGAVLIAAITAIFVGLVIFVPEIISAL